MMDHKLGGLVSTENIYYGLIISLLVALMMDQSVIHEAQRFCIPIVLNKCNALLLALNCCINDKLDCLKPRPSLRSIRNGRTSVVMKHQQCKPNILNHHFL